MVGNNLCEHTSQVNTHILTLANSGVMSASLADIVSRDVPGGALTLTSETEKGKFMMEL